MGFLIHPEYWARWLGIVIIDLSLAGDNALVIAMAVLTLPPGQRLVGMRSYRGTGGLELYFFQPEGEMPADA